MTPNTEGMNMEQISCDLHAVRFEVWNLFVWEDSYIDSVILPAGYEPEQVAELTKEYGKGEQITAKKTTLH